MHILSQWSKRRGISEVIAVLLLIVLTVAASVVLYSFARGLLPNLSSGGPSSLVTGGGQMTIPGFTGVSGILTVNLRNEGSKPISSISATCANPPFNTVNCSTPSLTFLYQGSAISAFNPLPVNALASGTAGVIATTTFTAGTSYALILSIVFVGGSTQTVVLLVSSTS
jgi:flagellin-like protein